VTIKRNHSINPNRRGKPIPYVTNTGPNMIAEIKNKLQLALSDTREAEKPRAANIFTDK
jgi:hypothetical protein